MPASRKTTVLVDEEAERQACSVGSHVLAHPEAGRMEKARPGLRRHSCRTKPPVSGTRAGAEWQHVLEVWSTDLHDGHGHVSLPRQLAPCQQPDRGRLSGFDKESSGSPDSWQPQPSHGRWPLRAQLTASTRGPPCTAREHIFRLCCVYEVGISIIQTYKPTCLTNPTYKVRMYGVLGRKYG